MIGSMVGGSIGIYRKVVQREMLGVIERGNCQGGIVPMVNLQDQGMVLLHQIDTAGLNMMVIQEMGRKELKDAKEIIAEGVIEVCIGKRVQIGRTRMKEWREGQQKTVLVIGLQDQDMGSLLLH